MQEYFLADHNHHTRGFQSHTEFVVFGASWHIPRSSWSTRCREPLQAGIPAVGAAEGVWSSKSDHDLPLVWCAFGSRHTRTLPRRVHLEGSPVQLRGSDVLGLMATNAQRRRRLRRAGPLGTPETVKEISFYLLVSTTMCSASGSITFGRSAIFATGQRRRGVHTGVPRCGTGGQLLID